MSADVTKLGTLLDANAQRDAVHIAVAPVVAAESLAPGDRIGFVQGEDTTERVQRRLAGAIGIVDPFLTTRVMPGERFWMFLYPQTITSLRHQWTHPAFEPEPPIPEAASELWMRDFASQLGLSYDATMNAIHQFVEHGVHYIFGRDTPAVVHVRREEMWKHYEVLTDTKVSEVDKEDAPFSCAC